MAYAYEHIVMHIKKYYKYNMWPIAAKSIVGITKDNTYCFVQ